MIKSCRRWKLDLVEEAQNLKELKTICRKCTQCPLADTRQNVVFGEGSGETGIFMLGEAPGVKEDRMGKPFVGRSGDVLNLALGRAGFYTAEIREGKCLLTY